MSYKEKGKSKKGDKLTQIVQNFFFKASNIIVQSRAQVAVDAQNAKLNKWFNIQLNDVLTKDELKLWKLSNSIVNEETNSILNLPPMVIEIFLDLRHLTPSQTLILNQEDKSYNVTQGNLKNEVILERWLLEFDLGTFDLNVTQLPSIYKNVLISFRILYTFVRLLPCFRLRQKIAKTTLNQSLNIGYRILDGNLPIHSKGRIGLSKNLIDRSMKEILMTKKFEPILTNVGSLRISVSYRSNCDFNLNDKEELLSSQFMKMDYTSTETTAMATANDVDEVDDGSNTADRADGSQNSTLDTQDKPPQLQPLQIKENPHLKRLSIQSNYSLSPGSIFLKEFSPSQTKLRRSSSSASKIHPFKVGSVSSSIPQQQQQQQQQPVQQHQQTSSTPPFLGNESLLHDNNNSTTSLAAMLRQQRASFSSQQTAFKPLYVGSIDSSISHDSGNTPRFSSSFGSRYRRQKSTSKLHDEDDLDQFIKQLDMKPDLRLSLSPQDSLEKYQIMQKNHNTLSDSINASILQNQSSSQKELRLINYDQPTKKLTGHQASNIGQQAQQERRSSQEPLQSEQQQTQRELKKQQLRLSSPTSQPPNAAVTQTRSDNANHSDCAIIDDDDDEEDNVGPNITNRTKLRSYSRNNNSNEEEEDLLFTMSDMNLR